MIFGTGEIEPSRYLHSSLVINQQTLWPKAPPDLMEVTSNPILNNFDEEKTKDKTTN